MDLLNPWNTKIVRTAGRFACLLVALGALGAAAVAQDAPPEKTEPAPTTPAADLPPAEKVLARFVEALGGEKALRSRKSFHATGTFGVPSQGLEGPLHVYAKAPNKALIVIEIGGIGEVRQGFDGKIAWAIEPMSGPQILDGAMAETIRIDADFFGPLNYAKNFKSITTVDKTEFAGAECYKLEMVDQLDQKRLAYFSVETGLQLGGEATMSTPMGEIDTVTTMSDYKEYGGLLSPMKTVTSMMGMEQVIMVESIEYDTVDDGLFELPEEIKNRIPEAEAEAEDD